MARAASHGPGEMVSWSLIGCYASLHVYSVHTAHSKKGDRSILWGIDLSPYGARQLDYFGALVGTSAGEEPGGG